MGPGPEAPRPSRLIIKPNPVPLGRRIVVILTGVNPNERVRFASHPTTAGFGGGLMGTHRAGKRGTIIFSYPAFTKRWELGTWIITAQRANGTMLQTRLRVVEQPTPQPTPIFPPLSPVRRWRLHLATRTDGPSVLSNNTVATQTLACTTCGVVLSLTNLSNRNRRQVARLRGQDSPVVLALSASWLVWLQEPAPTDRWTWTLHAWSRQTGKDRIVASSVTGGGPEITLDGATLAWTRQSCHAGCTTPEPSSLQLTDLQSGKTRIVARSSDPCRPITSPSLSRAVLSWVQPSLSGYGCSATNVWLITARNRANGQEIHRAIHLPSAAVADEFTGYAWHEAWSAHRQDTNRDTRVVLTNLKTGARRHVTRLGAYSPRLTGQTLAWLGDFGGTVEAMDLTTGRYFLLARRQENKRRVLSRDLLGVPWQNRVIWDEVTFNPNGGPFRQYLAVAAVP